MNDEDDHVVVSHAEFVARRHRRLRVIEELQRQTEAAPNESDCQADPPAKPDPRDPRDPDVGEQDCTPLQRRAARRPVPLAFPRLR